MTVYDFDDYRDYLLFKYEEIKSVNTNFSFQYCANYLGTSKNFLKLVIDKKRHISSNRITKICKLFKITDLEQNYFIMQIYKNTTADLELKSHFQGIMDRIKSYAARDVEYKTNINEGKNETLFNNWLKLSLFEVVKLVDFQNNPEWIYNRFGRPDGISAADIARTLEELIQEGHLKYDGGSLVQDKFITSTPSGFDTNDFNVYKIGLLKTCDVIDHFDELKPFGHFHMLFLSLTQEQGEELMQDYIKLRDKMVKWGKENKDGCEDVYIINNHFLTLTIDRKKMPDK